MQDGSASTRLATRRVPRSPWAGQGALYRAPGVPWHSKRSRPRTPWRSTRRKQLKLRPGDLESHVLRGRELGHYPSPVFETRIGYGDRPASRSKEVDIGNRAAQFAALGVSAQHVTRCHRDFVVGDGAGEGNRTRGGGDAALYHGPFEGQGAFESPVDLALRVIAQIYAQRGLGQIPVQNVLIAKVLEHSLFLGPRRPQVYMARICGILKHVQDLEAPSPESDGATASMTPEAASTKWASWSILLTPGPVLR